MSDIEGKIARVATSEFGNEQVSNRIRFCSIARWIYAGVAAVPHVQKLSG